LLQETVFATRFISKFVMRMRDNHAVGLNVWHCTPMYKVSQKNCAKLFLSELRQISINFSNFGR